MSTNGKCWAVASGEYSDYSITAVFPTEAMAGQFAEAMNAKRARPYGDDYFVEELPYFEEPPEVYREYTVFGILQEDGSIEFGDFDNSPAYGPTTRSRRPTLGIDGLSRPHRPQVSFHGEDIEQCKRAVQDYIARWKAEKAGIT